MVNKKQRTDMCFRSVSEVKEAYLPTLLKSQSVGVLRDMVERTAEVTEHTLRKRVRKG